MHRPRGGQRRVREPRPPAAPGRELQGQAAGTRGASPPGTASLSLQPDPSQDLGHQWMRTCTGDQSRSSFIHHLSTDRQEWRSGLPPTGGSDTTCTQPLQTPGPRTQVATGTRPMCRAASAGQPGPMVAATLRPVQYPKGVRAFPMQRAFEELELTETGFLTWKQGRLMSYRVIKP